MTITLHQGDIPADIDFGSSIAVDTEAMGLLNHRDRLCLVQLSAGDGTAHLVQFRSGQGYDAPNLKKLLSDPEVTKIFQYARFDIALIKKYLDVECAPIYCTKIASYLARTYTDRHGLRDLCRELLDVDLKKQQQSSDWGADELTQDQLLYAANDVLYLHDLKARLDKMLVREGRMEMAQKCFEFIPVRADLDLAGWLDVDIFAH
ncbi:MAG: ribonuclease D [Rhodospirillales bacterium]|nr:ribonuclease D [Rhodospirillales bacterium]